MVYIRLSQSKESNRRFDGFASPHRFWSFNKKEEQRKKQQHFRWPKDGKPNCRISLRMPSFRQSFNNGILELHRLIRWIFIASTKLADVQADSLIEHKNQFNNAKRSLKIPLNLHCGSSLYWIETGSPFFFLLVRLSSSVVRSFSNSFFCVCVCVLVFIFPQLIIFNCFKQMAFFPLLIPLKCKNLLKEKSPKFYDINLWSTSLRLNFIMYACNSFFLLLSLSLSHSIVAAAAAAVRRIIEA